MNEPTGEHPDGDALCDLEAGVLEGSGREADLLAHVTDCSACQEFLALLATTRGHLAELAQPIPPDVAQRIDAALATEAAGAPAQGSDTGSETGSETGSNTVVTPLRRGARGRPRWLPAAGAVAAGLALLMAGAVGIGAFNGGYGSSPETAAGAGGDRSVATPQEALSGQSYSSATLADRVRGLVARQSAAAGAPAAKTLPSPPGVQQDSAASLTRLSAPAQLAACVAELAGNTDDIPLAVDYGEYDGRPAAVIVLPGPTAAAVQAWVVGAGCTTGNPDVLEHQVVPLAG